MPSAQNWKSQPEGPFHWPTPQLPSRLLRQTGNDIHGYPFSSLGTGISRYELDQAKRQDVVLIHIRFALQHPLQFWKCGLLRCPVAPKHLLRVYLGIFHGWRFSAGLASLNSIFLLGKKSNIITPFASQNTVAIILPADGCFLNFFELGYPGPTHWRLWALFSGS